MLSQKMQEALNKQVNEEFFSAYLYLAMSAYFESMNLSGFANWMYVQYQEENTHALKIFKYIIERDAEASLKAIDTPQLKWESPLHAFEDALNHKKKVSALINNLTDLALIEKDHATNNFLQWFISEQVQEEANAKKIKDQLKLIGNSSDGLFMLDKELALRVFVDETISPA